LGLLNYYVRGLDKEMVPIRPLGVRVCQYSLDGQLVDSNSQGLNHATELADDTNHLSTGSAGSARSGASRLGWRAVWCHPPSTYFVTLASQTQQVNIESYQCGAVVNGAIAIEPNAKWFRDVYTDEIAGRDIGGGPTG